MLIIVSQSFPPNKIPKKTIYWCGFLEKFKFSVSWCWLVEPQQKTQTFVHGLEINLEYQKSLVRSLGSFELGLSSRLSSAFWVRPLTLMNSMEDCGRNPLKARENLGSITWTYTTAIYCLSFRYWVCMGGWLHHDILVCAKWGVLYDLKVLSSEN